MALIMFIRSIYFSPVAHPYVGHTLLRIRRARPISSPTMQTPVAGSVQQVGNELAVVGCYQHLCM